MLRNALADQPERAAEKQLASTWGNRGRFVKRPRHGPEARSEIGRRRVEWLYRQSGMVVAAAMEET